MKTYLEMIEDCLNYGERKENRTGVDTLVTTPKFFEHDMRTGFPLITTKKMAVKTMAVELEGFIGGITDKKWYQDRGCRIWNEWANPQTVAIMDRDNILDKEVLAKGCLDLGPIYGYQARRFGMEYTDGEPIRQPFEPLWNDECDQLAYAVGELQNNPNNRRLVVSHWNPQQSKQMALKPCHYTYVFQHINGKLSLHWTQRSCDSFLGVPFNIASYALLLELVAKHTGLTPHMLTGTLVDFHIYENHVEQIKLQLSRETFKLPILILPDEVDIFNWTHKDFKLNGYEYHPSIKGEVAV